MTIEWKKQSFQTLKESYESPENEPDLTSEKQVLNNRYGNIECFIESDQIWPPANTGFMEQFKISLREVLSRLPDADFSMIESDVRFVVEDPELDAFAVNASASISINPSSPGDPTKIGMDIIVFFRKCLGFSPDALIGLIAHELAHSFVSGKDYVNDEDLTNAKARSWGFERELDCLQLEKDRILALTKTP